jgi:fused signal recognition particle receptor
MFGGFKKKLQDAIAKVTSPKKEEIEKEIKAEEVKQDKAELHQEVAEFESREKGARELIENRQIEKFDAKIAGFEKSIKVKNDKENVILEKVEERVMKEQKEDIEALAKEEFEKISRHEQIPKQELALEEIEKQLERINEEPSLVEKKKEERKSLIGGIVRRIAEKTIEEKDIKEMTRNLETALLENDTALEVAEKICAEVSKSLVGQNIRRGDVEGTVKAALRKSMLEVMSQKQVDIEKMIEAAGQPLLVMFLGFNGTGKTTTLCKFAYKFRSFNPVIAAGDTFRAASIEQLEEHGRRLGMRVIKQDYGSDSAAVIYDARKHAASAGSRLVLADTAGRSHSNVNLMDELKKVVRVNKPDLKILVLDSVTGNDIYEQARLFNDAVGVDAIILTKADVYDKGGAALSAAYTIKKPIIYIGIGQGYEDLKEFSPEDVVRNLLE